MSENIGQVILTPEVFSDNWFEANAELFKQAISTGIVNLDFSNTRWVELSTLMLLSGLIIKNARNIKRIELLFQAPSDNDDTSIKDSFVFFIESNFFVAVNDSIRESDSVCRIWIRLPGATMENALAARNKISKYFGRQIKVNKIDNVIPIQKTSSNDLALGINLNFLDPEVRIDSGIFASLGFQKAIDHDIFILPITYLKQQDVADFIDNFKVGSDFVERVLARGNSHIDIEISEVVSYLPTLWVNELLHNAIEHGGEKCLICIRYGPWSLRDRSTSDGYRICDSGYAFRTKYLEKNPSFLGMNFVEVIVLDTGEGFSSLYESYKCNHSEAVEGNYLGLHRFALFPHSSRKTTIPGEVRITGLGVLAEQIIDTNGILAIKDKGHLSYFDKDSLKALTSQARKDYVSIQDFGCTVLDAILPIPNINWKKRYYVTPLDLKHGELVSFAYISLMDNKEISYGIVNNSEKRHYPIRLNISDINETNYSIIVIDVTSKLSNFVKSTVKNIVDIARKYQSKNMTVIVYGPDIPEMKILQGYIESEGRLAKTINNINPKSIEFVVINPYFDLFICGRLEFADRLKITEALNTGETSEDAELANFVQKCNIPARTIERGINRIRGALFLEELKINYYINCPVQDKHGNILDSYYDVKSYLSLPENRFLWVSDVKRLIRKHDADVVIVDCPEVRALIDDAYKSSFDHIKVVGRLNDGIVEIDNTKISVNSKILILLSCAYSGTTLKAIPAIISRSKLPIKAVCLLLDLTDTSSENVTRQIGVKFDRFSRSVPPRKIKKTTKPLYIATRHARLVAAEHLTSSSENIFNTFTPKTDVYSLLRLSPNVYRGHTVEHGHHYDIFIDVRRSISQNDILGQRFVHLVQSKITSGCDKIIYNEESELFPILERVKYAPGNRLVEFIPVRQVFDDIYTYSNYNKPLINEKSKILIIDEGAYSCNSLYGILKLVLQDKPSIIEVVVLEKRFTENSAFLMLRQVADAGKKSTEIRFSTVIDISAPAWLKNDCPYCNIEIGEHKNKPKQLNKPIIVSNISLTTDAEFQLWFLEKLYSGREPAMQAIKYINSIADSNQAVLLLLARLLIIHGKILFNWGLVVDAISVIGDAFIYARVRWRCYLIELITKCPIEVRGQFLQLAVRSNIHNIDNINIFYKLYDAVKNNINYLPAMDNAINALNLINSKKQRWQYLCQKLDSSIMADAVENLFAITKINRTTHKNLGDEISEAGPMSTDVKEKIETLSRVIEKIEAVPPIKELKEALRDTLRLSQCFMDKCFIKRLNDSLTFNVDLLVRELCAIVCKTNEVCDTKHLLRKRYDGTFEAPIVCLTRTNLLLLKDLLQDNQRYGFCSIESSIKNGNLELILLTTNVVTEEEFLEIQKSISMLHLSHLLRATSGNFEYFKQNSELGIKINLKVVDHVKA